jgi:hypothetical protein
MAFACFYMLTQQVTPAVPKLWEKRELETICRSIWNAINNNGLPGNLIYRKKTTNSKKLSRRNPATLPSTYSVQILYEEFLMCFYILDHPRSQQRYQFGEHVWQQVLHSFWHKVRKLLSHVIRHRDSSLHSFKHVRHDFGHDHRH